VNPQSEPRSPVQYINTGESIIYTGALYSISTREEYPKSQAGREPRTPNPGLRKLTLGSVLVLAPDNGNHLTEDGEFGMIQFRDMMKGELWRYSRRELVNVLAFSDSEEFKSTVVMLKIMDTKLAQVLGYLGTFQDCTSTIHSNRITA
jgi:hypothetical protein